MRQRKELQDGVCKYLAKLHQKLLSGAVPRGRNGRVTVIILSRYRADRSAMPSDWKTAFGSTMDVEFLPVHRSKGREADSLFSLAWSTAASRACAATIIYHSDEFLYNSAPEVHSTMHYGGVQRHAPATHQNPTDSFALSDLAPNYDKAIGSVRKSLYSLVASRAKQRVEI